MVLIKPIKSKFARSVGSKNCNTVIKNPKKKGERDPVSKQQLEFNSRLIAKVQEYKSQNGLNNAQFSRLLGSTHRLYTLYLHGHRLVGMSMIFKFKKICGWDAEQMAELFE